MSENLSIVALVQAAGTFSTSAVNCAPDSASAQETHRALILYAEYGRLSSGFGLLGADKRLLY
ncbi:MAG: hypothetical protein EB015_07885 [Methylocystaceae bacterium]|nr:hypothetical protein [Methylocystaceae bacterium]